MPGNDSITADLVMLRSPLSNPAPRPVARRISGAARWFRFLVLGTAAAYFVFGRTFAYFGIPGLYPGELLLLAAAVGRYSWIRMYLSAIRLRPGLAIPILLCFLWGCTEGVRGFIAGYPIIDVAKGLPAHYYPFLLFAGLSAGRLITMEGLQRYFAWLTVATGLTAAVSAIAINREIATGLPWAPEVSIYSGATLVPFCLLAYVGLSKKLNLRSIAVALPTVVALLIGGRGALLAAIVGFALLAFRLRYLFRIAVPALVGLICWFAFSAFLPDFGGRSGRATPSLVAARLISMVDPQLAVSLVEGTEGDLHTDADDVQWRRDLWNDAIESLTSASDWWMGHGYGPVLGDLLPGEGGEGYGHELRSPHNFAIYLLGYTGLIGCVLYFAVFARVLMEILGCPQSPAKNAALAAGASVIVMALAGNILETPFGAVPAWVGVGLMLSVAQRQDFSQSINAGRM